MSFIYYSTINLLLVHHCLFSVCWLHFFPDYSLQITTTNTIKWNSFPSSATQIIPFRKGKVKSFKNWRSKNLVVLSLSFLIDLVNKEKLDSIPFFYTLGKALSGHSWLQIWLRLHTISSNNLQALFLSSCVLGFFSPPVLMFNHSIQFIEETGKPLL